jgi:hypothetical protein
MIRNRPSRSFSREGSAGLMALSIFSIRCGEFAPDEPMPGASGASAGSAAVGTAGTGEVVPPKLAPERSVIASDPAVIAKLTFDRVLFRLAGTDAHSMYLAFARTFAPRDASDVEPGQRCDDEGPAVDGVATLNGFPIPCPSEASNFIWANESKVWKPLSVTNRFDLAPLGGENCGEQQVSFYFDTFGTGLPEYPAHASLRFSAVIENPAPELGLEGCRPLADFWASLSGEEYDNPTARADALEAAFLGSSVATGTSVTSPALEALSRAGFRPFVSPEHFGRSGRLQLWYLGDVGLWAFFEHALVSKEEGWVIRRPLSQSLPVLSLLARDPSTNPCAQSLLDAIPGLLDEDPTKQRMNVPPTCFAGVSSIEDPTLAAGLHGLVNETAYGPALAKKVEETLSLKYPEHGLFPEDIARRADFAGTCVGCHDLKDSPFTASGTLAHVNHRRTEPCGAEGSDETRSCYALSPLLKFQFLPRWTDLLQTFWERPGAFPPLPNGVRSTTAVDGTVLVQQNP